MRVSSLPVTCANICPVFSTYTFPCFADKDAEALRVQ